MSSSKPRATVRFTEDEYAALQEWAELEFRSVPQLIVVIVKKALMERQASQRQSQSNAQDNKA